MILLECLKFVHFVIATSRYTIDASINYKDYRAFNLLFENKNQR